MTSNPTRLRKAPHPAALAVPRRRGERTRTIPEQIADHLGVAILNGEYHGGERVREQEVADLYGVSRGPVREAIRMLETRGLVRVSPRRGASVTEVTVDAIADTFNVRSTLLGLAARCFAREPAPVGLAELLERIGALQSLAEDDEADPVEFAKLAGEVGGSIYRHSGNGPLRNLMRGQNVGSYWGLIWRERPLDFFTPERRRQASHDWAEIGRAIQAGDDQRAERLTRKTMFESRDVALETLQQLRHEQVHPAKQFQDLESSSE